MQIQLYDRGSPQGKSLFGMIEEICDRYQIDDDPEYFHDMKKIIDMGLQAKTVLMIDREIILVDKYPTKKELEDIMSDYLRPKFY